jgi:hypothetical protein
MHSTIPSRPGLTLGRVGENQLSATGGMVCNPPFFSHFVIDLSNLLAEDRRKSRELSRKIMRSRERNAAKRQASQQRQGFDAELPNPSTDNGRGVTRDQRLESDVQSSQTRGRSTQKHPLGTSSKPKPRVRVRESNVPANEDNTRGIARSPTPGSTDVEPEEPDPTTQATNCKLLLFFIYVLFIF